MICEKIFFDEKENAKYSWSSVQLAGKASVMESVIVICPNEIIKKSDEDEINFINISSFSINENSFIFIIS